MNEPGASRALYRGGLFLLVIFIAALILHELIGVLMQLFVASIIAAAMTPIVNAVASSERFRRLRWQPPRGVVVLLMFLLAGLITVVFGFFVLRAIAREITALLANLPQYVAAFTTWLATLAADHPALQDIDVNAWLATNMPVVLSGLAGVLGSMLGVVGFATSLLGGFLTILFTVFMALYLTIDAARMRDYLAVFWPTERQGRVTRMANEMGARLGHWAIGQGILCVVIGGGAWLGLQLVGVPYAALLGLVWALAEFVPGIGPFLSAIPSIALGFSVSPATGLAAAVFSLVWSQLENNVITPKIMGNAVELHPLVILVALLVGAELLGAPGALLAIPVAATLAVVVDEIRHERMRSQVGLSTDTIVPDDAAPAAPPIRSIAVLQRVRRR